MRLSATKHRQCGGKTPYTSHQRAAAAMERLVAQGTHEDSVRVYRCPRCRHYHFGHVGRITGRERWRRG